ESECVCCHRRVAALIVDAQYVQCYTWTWYSTRNHAISLNKGCDRLVAWHVSATCNLLYKYLFSLMKAEVLHTCFSGGSLTTHGIRQKVVSSTGCGRCVCSCGRMNLTYSA
ncbi:unnamed protein product, partial [Laminaria digitata]